MIDSKKEIRVSKVNDKRFKINFVWIFIICIIIMIADQIMKYLDYCLELFYGGDYIFHIIQSVITICSQLSVSVSAAIIFYYVLEFINQKNIIDDFAEIRKYTIFMLYKHMDIICNLESFKRLNRNKIRLEDPCKMFLVVDIPILLDCYNNCNRDKFKRELNDYFIKIYKDTEKKRICPKDLQEFHKDIEKLLEYKRVSFYKGYKEDIESLQSIHEDMMEYAESYSSEDFTGDNYKNIIYIIVDDYITFLDECIHTYHIIERYIQCLRYKKFVEFMKMRD